MNTQSHEALRGLLHMYATDLLQDRLTQQHYADLILHLESCLDCQHELAAIIELASPLYAGTVESVAIMPDINLDFLGSKVPASVLRPIWQQRMGEWVVGFYEQLLVSLKPAAFAQATRGGVLYHLQDHSPDLSYQLTVDVYADHQHPDCVQLQVYVVRSDDDPLGESSAVARQVTLHTPRRNLVRTTVETGGVVFNAIQRDELAELRIAFTA